MKLRSAELNSIGPMHNAGSEYCTLKVQAHFEAGSPDLHLGLEKSVILFIFTNKLRTERYIGIHENVIPDLLRH